jgi:hypothetical protein
VKKRLIAAAFVVLGLVGVVGAAAPSASALYMDKQVLFLHVHIDTGAPPCLRADFVILGQDVGPLKTPVCL